MSQAPTRIIIVFFGNAVFLCVFLCVIFMFPNVSKKKQLDRGLGGWGLINPSFSLIFDFFLAGQDPLL